MELDQFNDSHIPAALIILAELIKWNGPPKNNGDIPVVDKGEWTVANPYPMQLLLGTL